MGYVMRGSTEDCDEEALLAPWPPSISSNLHSSDFRPQEIKQDLERLHIIEASPTSALFLSFFLSFSLSLSLSLSVSECEWIQKNNIMMATLK